jgi:hypothetical protein
VSVSMPSPADCIATCISEIEQRRLSSGGFSETPLAPYRPDATAWAVMALAVAGLEAEMLDHARSCLAAGQLPDGRIAVTPDEPHAFWPTPLAVVAWQGSAHYREPQRRAVNFLLETSGVYSKKQETNSILGHDPSIRGWSWTEETSPWVEPTALAVLALDVSGHGHHPRVKEAVSMLLNRQLAHGGWNYGNTTVYGQELRPLIESTGVALAALAGHAPQDTVQASLGWLRSQAQRCRTPLSLGWALFGLGAWGLFPADGMEWVAEALGLQERYGTYRTTLLSLLAIAAMSRGEIRKSVSKAGYV